MAKETPGLLWANAQSGRVSCYDPKLFWGGHKNTDVTPLPHPTIIDLPGMKLRAKMGRSCKLNEKTSVTSLAYWSKNESLQ
jgi:hypothetical protein